MKESHTTIEVSRENRDRIASFGKAGESLNDALSRALDMAEAKTLIFSRTDPFMSGYVVAG